MDSIQNYGKNAGGRIHDGDSGALEPVCNCFYSDYGATHPDLSDQNDAVAERDQNAEEKIYGTDTRGERRDPAHWQSLLSPDPVWPSDGRQ